MDSNITLLDEFNNLHIAENFTANQHSMDEYNPSVQMRIFYACLFLILETVGNFLLFCMIIYEKYGMDSQKRTITNQLLSSICWSAILWNIFFMPIIMIARIYGPLSKLMSKTSIFPN